MRGSAPQTPREKRSGSMLCLPSHIFDQATLTDMCLSSTRTMPMVGYPLPGPASLLQRPIILLRKLHLGALPLIKLLCIWEGLPKHNNIYSEI
eukprot:2505965-Heterocapsa_arctica.AAC.1